MAYIGCGVLRLPFIVIVASTLMVVFVLNSQGINGEPQVPCYFIFGDSLVDNGNNNQLQTLAKANYPPYGIDSFGPTGRFTNGRTIADFIGQLLGFQETILPFATARGQEIVRGINYGSGGAGILEDSGEQLGDRISLTKQLLNHGRTIARLIVLQRNLSFTGEFLSKCIYTVGMGSNDYINNYFMPQLYPSSHLFTPEQFAEKLIEHYYLQLKFLYKQGARKVAVFGLGGVGCAPAEAAMFATNGSICADNVNNAVQLFDQKLKPLIQKLNSELLNAKYTYINISSITSGDPSTVGITIVNAPCCILRADSQCSPNTTPCSNRSVYAFYDGFHPTEIVNYYNSLRVYNSTSPEDAYPVDISHLAQL